MTEHIVAYVQKKLITAWKRNTLKHCREDNQPTFLYSSNDSWQFGPYARSGAVLWVIASQPPDPPALVAKLDNIQQVCVDIDRLQIPDRLYQRFGRRLYVVRGGEKSRFFGHNNVSKLLLEMKYLDKDGTPWSLVDCKSNQTVWQSSFGIRLLRPARIAGGDRGAFKLQRYSERLLSRTIFISYKRRDHSKELRRNRMRQFVRELVNREYAVWLDRIALPATRGPKDRKHHYSQAAQDRMLTILLQQGLDDSKVLLAISSACYGAPSRTGKRNWTKDEWNSISRNADRDSPCIPTVWSLAPQTSPDSEVDLSETVPFSSSKSAKRAAEDFDKWFKRSRSSRNLVRNEG
jgi:hypothetical protein